MARNPSTPQEWQEAVDAAEFYLGVDAARQYGLLTTSAQVNVGRCVEVLEEGKSRGYLPKPMKELCEIFIEKKGGL